jgi:hypothetical protein
MNNKEGWTGRFCQCVCLGFSHLVPGRISAQSKSETKNKKQNQIVHTVMYSLSEYFL